MEYLEILGIFWLIFILFWVFSAMNVKKSRTSWWGEMMWLRIGVIILFIFLFRIPQFKFIFLDTARRGISQNPIIESIGVILCGLGIALAIWARVYLGRDWGQPMTMREKPELVTSGVYKYIRHPIYAGVFLAIFGSFLVGGFLWLMLLIVVSMYFIYSAKVEEKNMTKEFPKEYPKYMEKTKMFVPFLV